MLNRKKIQFSIDQKEFSEKSLKMIYSSIKSLKQGKVSAVINLKKYKKYLEDKDKHVWRSTDKSRMSNKRAN